MTTGAKIQYLRKKQNITQEQLADYLGVSRQSVSKWESDGAYPETDKLVRLSSLFQVSLDYLLREDFETAEQLTKKNETIRFNTATFVFAMISGFGYVGGITLTYITVDPLVGLLVMLGMICLSTVLYAFQRGRFLSKSEYSDQDRNTLMKNTRIMYSTAWMAGFLFLPILIPAEVQVDLGLGLFVVVEGIFSFGSYLLLALLSGLIGLFLLTGIISIHRKKSLNRNFQKFPTGMLVTDLGISLIGAVAFVVLMFLGDVEVGDYALLIAFLLVLIELVIFPIVFLVKKRIPKSRFFGFIATFIFDIAAILLVISYPNVWFELGFISSGIGLVLGILLFRKAFQSSLKEKDTPSFLLLKGAWLTLFLTVGIVGYRWGFHQIDPIVTFWERALPVFFSLVLILGFFEADLLFLKKVPDSSFPNEAKAVNTSLNGTSPSVGD